MIKRLLLTLSLLASGAQAAVDLTAKPASGTFTFNSSWTGANGAVEPTTYYHIDEGSGTTLNDLGAENADGTITGADWVTDGSAAALDFVSANVDYVTNLAAWGIANTSTDWTVAVLVSIDSGVSNDSYFSLGDTTLTQTNGGQEYMFGGVGTSTHTVGNRYHGGTLQSDNGASYTATTWQLMWFQWTASTRTLKVFTDNGTEDTGIALVVTSGEQVPDAADGRIGTQATSSLGQPADARIAGVYIWKSTALTAAQMQDVCDWNGSNCEPWPFLTPSGTCPATCAGGRSARCITDISDASDADNILYGLSPAATANEDTVCYDPSSVLGDTVNVSAAGWPSIASGGSQLTDSFDYCIMDNGDPCGTDGTYEVTFQPTITSVTGIGTGQTTGTVTVTPAGPTEGTVRGVAISKTSYDTYGAPTHAQIAAGVDGNNANVAWGSEFTKSFLSTVSPGWTFGRASSQTYEKSDGTLGTVTSGNPAFTYSSGTAQGVLLEGERTNLVAGSEEYGGSGWSAAGPSTLTANAAVAPDGTTTAERLQATAVAGYYISWTISATVPHTLSYYVKNNSTSDKVRIGVGGTPVGGGDKYFEYDPATAAFSSVNALFTSYSSVVAPNGYRRVLATFTAAATGTAMFFLYGKTGGTDVYLWGGQVGPGSLESSYIPTTTAAVTRVATSLTRSWTFDPNDFSGYIEAYPGFASTETGATNPVFSAYKDANNYLSITHPTTSGRMDLNLAIGGTTATAQVTGLTWAKGDKLDIRFRKSASGIKLWVEAGSTATTTGVAPNDFSTPPDTVRLGRDESSNYGFWTVENIQLWNSVDDTALGALN